MTTPADLRKHIDEDAMDLYVLGRLDIAAQEAIEEHVFLCRPCLQLLEESEDFITALRAIGAYEIPKAVEATPEPPPPSPKPRPQRLCSSASPSRGVPNVHRRSV